jgi:hypothetical protein
MVCSQLIPPIAPVSFVLFPALGAQIQKAFPPSVHAHRDAHLNKAQFTSIYALTTLTKLRGALKGFYPLAALSWVF